MIVSEIGLNHIRKIKLLNNYIDKLSQTKIDAITLQILSEEDLKKKKLQYCHLENFEVDSFIKKVINKNKKVGLALGDYRVLDNLKLLKKINFFKVLSKDFKNTKLIKYLIKNTKAKIYMSTGLSVSKDIFSFLKKYKSFKNRISLIYTNFDQNVNPIHLTNIELMRNKYNIDVSFSNHSHDKKMIYLSNVFSPESIFFYIKTNFKNRKISFADDQHALKINEISKYLKKIQNIHKI